MSLQPFDLRCEGLEAPLGVGVTAPRLSWRLRSSGRGVEPVAFRVRVCDPEVPVWDSGRVGSDAVAAVYAGPPLTSRAAYRWTVKVWAA